MKVAQLCPILCNPMNYTVHGILQARMLEWVSFPFSRGSSQPGIKPRSPELRADSLSAEPPGKPKNSGWVAFPTLESNQGLLQLQEDSLPAELPEQL